MPTGSIDLDIKRFDGQMATVIKRISDLEPEVKRGTAVIKELENELDRLGSSMKVGEGKKGIFTKEVADDLKFQKGNVKGLKQELMALNKEKNQLLRDEKSRASQQAKEEKGGHLGNRYSALHRGLAKIGVPVAIVLAAQAVLSLVSALVNADRKTNELTKALDDLDKVPFQNSLDEGEKSAQRFKGAMLDLGAAISKIPIIGTLFDIFTAPLKHAAEFKKLLIETNNVINRNTAGSTGQLQKLNDLEEQRAKLRKSDTSIQASATRNFLGHLGIVSPEDLQRQDALQKIEEARADTLQNATRSIREENKARNEEIAGSTKAAKIAQIRLEKEAEIAKATQEAKEKGFGETSIEGHLYVKAATDSAEKNAAVKEAAAEREQVITLDTLEASSKIAEQKVRGQLGSEESAKQEFELSYRTYEAEKNTTTKRRAQAAADLASKAAAYDIERRNTALAMIQNTESKEVMEARKAGYRAESQAAEAAIKAAQARGKALSASPLEKEAAKTAEDAAREQKRIAEINEAGQEALIVSQTKVSDLRADDLEKQKQSLAAQGDKLKAEEKELKRQADSNEITAEQYIKERQILNAKQAQNAESVRANELAKALQAATISTLMAQATAGRGYDEDHKVSLAKQKQLEVEIRKEIKEGHAETALQRAVDLRNEIIADKQRTEARTDELYSLRQQTDEMAAQQKGLTGLANETAIRAKYTAEITRQLRLQNNEADRMLETQMLETQQAIELRKSKAAEHDETPEQRRKARHADIVEARKARQQEKREDEQEGRGSQSQYASNQSQLPERSAFGYSGVETLARGSDTRSREKLASEQSLLPTRDLFNPTIIGSALSRGAYASPLIDVAKKHHETLKEQKARINEAKTADRDWQVNVKRILDELTKGQS